jgi:predicted secreted protein
MKWTSVLAIYLLIWWLVVFAVMPFGIRTHREMGEDLVPGQVHSAPGNFRPVRIALWTTAISTALMALFYLNFVHGWITPHSFGWLFPLPRFMSGSSGH